MKRNLSRSLIVLLFLGGLLLLAIPVISNIYFQSKQAQVTEHYKGVIDNSTKEMRDEQRARAKRYNESLLGTAELVDPFAPTSQGDTDKEYMSVLDMDNTGVMGIVRIPNIQVQLPIYHGCETQILEKGAGHLTQTSFPIGGPSTHAVISAHTGSPKAAFFDNLIQLEEGDVFYIDVLEETLAYKVDQIKAVLPDQIEDLRVDTEKDLVTLVTCTPYGVNSHRLLVRGVRTEYNPEDDQHDGSYSLTNNKYFWLGVVCLILILIGIILFIKMYRKKKV